MVRLIDADDAVKEIAMILYDENTKSIMGQQLLSHINDLCYCGAKIRVANIKTAYDVDKVVEELDNYLFDKYFIEGDRRVNDIIKSGGAKK